MRRFLSRQWLRSSEERLPSGCLAALLTGAVSLLFLLLNVLLVQSSYTLLSAIWPNWTRDVKVAQACLLLGPILLLLMEWWLVELFADQWANRSSRRMRRRIASRTTRSS